MLQSVAIPPGTGKTHLATGLGVIAAHHGHRVLFATAVVWVARLQDAHRLGRLPAELARLRRYGLIIIDLCRGRDYADRRRGGGR
jgi:DNA replication protein DnaC